MESRKLGPSTGMVSHGNLAGQGIGRLLQQNNTFYERQNIKGLTNSSEVTSILDPGRVPRLGLILLLTFVSFAQAYHIFLSIESRPATVKEPNPAQGGILEADSMEVSDSKPLVPRNVSNLHGISEEKSKTYSDYVDNFGLPLIKILPLELSCYANVTEHPRKITEKPVFWHIPRAGGGSIVKQMASQCLKLVLSSEVGSVVNPQAAVSKELMVITDVVSGASFINVDTTWDKGIKRAKELGLAKSRLVDLIVVSNVYEAGSLFDHLHQGRLFTIMRHPIQRAVSVYYTMKDAAKTDVKVKNFLKGMSLEQYAASKIVENNWMTRFLSNKQGGELTPYDEAIAREVLAQKFIVGLLSEKQQSIERFMRYFGWTTKDPGTEDCIDEIVGWKWLNRASSHPEVKENGKIWKLLGEQNTFDMRLYSYAEELFRDQSFLFG